MTNTIEAYLGIDAGGTGTVASLATADGVVIGVGHGGAGNHVSVGADIARASICEAVNTALRQFNGTLTAVAFGTAGLETTGDLNVARSLLPASLAHVPLAFETDALMALEGALAGQPGIVIVAGTGAIAFGRDRSGGQTYAGGWGWRIGDEGSAYWIATQALTAVTKALDGRGPTTDLATAILHRLQISGADALVNWVYDPRRLPADFARLAETVAEQAEDGDSVAVGILNDGAAELVDAAKAVYEKQKADHCQPVLVSWAGGAFQSSVLRDRVGALLRAAGWGTLVCPRLTPALGAVLHARRLAEAAASDGRVWDVVVDTPFIGKLEQAITTRSDNGRVAEG